MRKSPPPIAGHMNDLRAKLSELRSFDDFVLIALLILKANLIHQFNIGH
jgi:hypothetical protein